MAKVLTPMTKWVFEYDSALKKFRGCFYFDILLRNLESIEMALPTFLHVQNCVNPSKISRDKISAIIISGDKQP